MNREDAVNRQAVCDYIAEFVNNEYRTQRECDMVDNMIKGIQYLPSVQPKPGTWRIDIDHSRGFDWRRFYCSECGGWQTYGEPKFCPKCGARMETKDNESV